MNATKHIASAILLLTATLSCACAEDERTRDPPPRPAAGVDAGAPVEPVSVTPSPLPGWANEEAPGSQYGPEVEPPDLCTWLGSVDAVVWGKLVAIDLPLTPASRPAINDDGWEWLPEGCPGEESTWLPALRLKIEVATVIKGELAPGTIEVVAGAFRRKALAPEPTLDSAGAVTWAAEPATAGEPLQIGQTIGVALHYLADLDVYSLLGESMFGQDASGAVVFQAETESVKHSYVRSPIAAAAGSSPTDLATAATSCGDAGPAAVERRLTMIDMWGPSDFYRNLPAEYATAYCKPDSSYWQTEPPPAGTCYVASDCSDGKLCICPEDDGPCTCGCLGGTCE